MSSLRIPSKAATATVIFLHGLGDTGHGFAFLAEEARSCKVLDHVNFVFPHAPEIPVTINMGAKAPAWYDIVEFGSLTSKQDKNGVLHSVAKVKELIQHEVDAGIPAHRIVLGGFSQGCAITLATLVTLEKRLAAFVGLSGYLPIKDELASTRQTLNAETPVFLGHGTEDNVVAIDLGRRTRSALQSEFGQKKVSWTEYPGMAHSVCPNEVDAVLSFLQKSLP